MSKDGGRGMAKKQKMEERASLFLCAPQDLHAQSDPAVPWPGKDPDEAGVDGRIYHVLSVRVVVKVPLKHLKQQNGRNIIIVVAVIFFLTTNKLSFNDAKSNALEESVWKNMSSEEPHEIKSDGFYREAGAGTFMPHFISDCSRLLPWRPHMHEQVLNEVHPIRAPAETLRGGAERCLNSDLFLALFLFVRRTSEHVDNALLSEGKNLHDL